MKVGVVMVKDGEEIIDTAVVLEEAVILSELKDIPRAIALLMGLLFSLNIDYPKVLRYTFEVIQNVLMSIGGGQVFLTCAWFQKQTPAENHVRLCSDDSSSSRLVL